MKRGKYLGFTLIELLLSMALSLLLMAGLTKVYLGIKASSDLQQAISLMQENAYFAIHLLNQRIRQAGYAGCVANNKWIDSRQAIRGYTSAQARKIAVKAVSGTDVLVVGECLLYKGHEKFIKVAYFVGNTYRKNKKNKSIYALYSQKIAGRREEIATGVSNLKFSIGRTGVKISLLINSINPILNKPKRYWFNGKWYMPKDRLLYKTWVSYVTLRERL